MDVTEAEKFAVAQAEAMLGRIPDGREETDVKWAVDSVWNFIANWSDEDIKEMITVLVKSELNKYEEPAGMEEDEARTEFHRILEEAGVDPKAITYPMWKRLWDYIENRSRNVQMKMMELYAKELYNTPAFRLANEEEEEKKGRPQNYTAKFETDTKSFIDALRRVRAFGPSFYMKVEGDKNDVIIESTNEGVTAAIMITYHPTSVEGNAFILVYAREILSSISKWTAKNVTVYVVETYEKRSVIIVPDDRYSDRVTVSFEQPVGGDKDLKRAQDLINQPFTATATVQGKEFNDDLREVTSGWLAVAVIDIGNDKVVVAGNAPSLTRIIRATTTGSAYSGYSGELLKLIQPKGDTWIGIKYSGSETGAGLLAVKFTVKGENFDVVVVIAPRIHDDIKWYDKIKEGASSPPPTAPSKPTAPTTAPTPAPTPKPTPAPKEEEQQKEEQKKESPEKEIWENAYRVALITLGVSEADIPRLLIIFDEEWPSFERLPSEQKISAIVALAKEASRGVVPQRVSQPKVPPAKETVPSPAAVPSAESVPAPAKVSREDLEATFIHGYSVTKNAAAMNQLDRLFSGMVSAIRQEISRGGTTITNYLALYLLENEGLNIEHNGALSVINENDQPMLNSMWDILVKYTNIMDYRGFLKYEPKEKIENAKKRFAEIKPYMFMQVPIETASGEEGESFTSVMIKAALAKVLTAINLPDKYGWSYYLEKLKEITGGLKT